MVSPSSFFLLPSSFFPYHGIVQDLSRFADFIWVVSEIRFDFVFQSLDPHSTTLFEDSCDQVIHLLNQYNLLILTPASTLFHHELMLGFMRPFSKHLRLNPWHFHTHIHTHMNPSLTQTLSSLTCTHTVHTSPCASNGSGRSPWHTTFQKGLSSLCPWPSSLRTVAGMVRNQYIILVFSVPLREWWETNTLY